MSVHSRLLIRDYDNIRHILRDVYIFGCYTRNDFQQQGIGSRKLDNELYRIREYLPDSLIQERRVNRQKIMYCSYHMLDGTDSCIADTYRNKSFTELDIMSYFRILRCLGSHEEMTLQEMANAIPDRNEGVLFDKDTLYPKLEELVEKGLVDRSAGSDGVRYRLSTDIWADYSDEELLDIYQLLDFTKNTAPLEAPYYLLQRKLRLYLYSERGIAPNDKQVFCYKHNHLFNALDNEVMLACLRGIHSGKLLRIIHRNKGLDTESIAVPVKLVHDALYGRQYLLCFDRARDSMSVIRLDRVQEMQEVGDWSEQERSMVEHWLSMTDLCWCMANPEQKPVKVEILFTFDEEQEAFILNRIYKEGHGGTVRRIAPGRYHYEIQVKDPVEMIPWIRSFGERARVLSSGEDRIEDRIHQDWRRAWEKYADI